MYVDERDLITSSWVSTGNYGDGFIPLAFTSPLPFPPYVVVTGAQDQQAYVQFALSLLDHVKSMKLSREVSRLVGGGGGGQMGGACEVSRLVGGGGQVGGACEVSRLVGGRGTDGRSL